MPDIVQHERVPHEDDDINSPAVAVLPDGTVHVFGQVNFVTGMAAVDFVNFRMPDRWFIVVAVSDQGLHAYSRRQTGRGQLFGGEWGLLTEDEAEQLAAAINETPDPDPEEHIEAKVVEVFRFAGDPIWTED